MFVYMYSEFKESLTVKHALCSFLCRSRTKNMMWYGVLGTKELLQRTYKNLEQKVQLEVRQRKDQQEEAAVMYSVTPKARTAFYYPAYF